MEWEEWKVMFGKGYSETEHDMRRAIFEANMKKIEKHNAQGLSWTMGVNQFADLTAEEFKAQISRPFKKTFQRSVEYKNTSSAVGNPSSIDWVDQGAVSPVKNQGQCGSCWSFSAIGAIEGCYAIANGKASSPQGVTQFAEQNLVDCDTQDSACNGGLMDYAFEFVIRQGGNMLENDYPYAARKQTCQTHSIVKTISKYSDVSQNSESQMENFLANGPVSVAIEADQNSFQFYNGGVFTGQCGQNLDHGVLAVGYGTDGGQKYWKVKNSWGASWGEQGYIRIQRGKSPSQCGILLSASQPQGCSGSGPTPPPGPTPKPGPSTGPYGPPTNGACPTGEQLVDSSVDGQISGSFCAPMCDTGDCPASSNLKGSYSSCGIYSYSQRHLYCGAFCNPQCTDCCDPANGSTCKSYGGYTGLCTYD